MNYRLSVAPGSPEDRHLKLLAEILEFSARGPGAAGTIGAMAGGQRTEQGHRRRLSMLLKITRIFFYNFLS